MTNYIYAKFRYTFPDDADIDELREEVGTYIAIFSQMFEPQLLTAGFETLDKCGEATHPHIHMHFTTSLTLGTMRKRFQRYAKDAGETRKGNHFYSLRAEEDVIDTHRFFRYPFKQGARGTCLGRIEMHNESFSEEFDEKIEIPLAIEEYERMVETNRKKIAKMLGASTYDKFVAWIKERTTDGRSCRSIESVSMMISIFYADEGMAMNTATMAGYVRTYCVNEGIISHLDNSARIASQV